MFVTTSAIVINRIKFKDNDLILKLYTKEHGLLTFISFSKTKPFPDLATILVSGEMLETNSNV